MPNEAKKIKKILRNKGNKISVKVVETVIKLDTRSCKSSYLIKKYLLGFKDE